MSASETWQASVRLTNSQQPDLADWAGRWLMLPPQPDIGVDMKIRILTKCYVGIEGRNFWPGESMDIDERMAKKMIARGEAEAVKAKKAPLKNRAFSAQKLETPEG